MGKKIGGNGGGGSRMEGGTGLEGGEWGSASALLRFFTFSFSFLAADQGRSITPNHAAVRSILFVSLFCEYA